MANIDPELEKILLDFVDLSNRIQQYLNNDKPKSTAMAVPRESARTKKTIYDIIPHDMVIKAVSFRVTRSYETWPGLRLLARSPFDKMPLLVIHDTQQMLSALTQQFRFNWAISDHDNDISIKFGGVHNYDIEKAGIEIILHPGECLVMIGDFTEFSMGCFDLGSRVWAIVVKNSDYDWILQKFKEKEAAQHAKDQSKQDDVSVSSGRTVDVDHS